MKIISFGDSWTWGSELVDPQTGKENDQYRLNNRYLKHLTDFYNCEVEDFSRPGTSNDTIYRLLLEYLTNNGYFEGRSTDDIFISIGWSSPERTEFFYKEKWTRDNWLEIGPWSMDHYIQTTPDIKEFLRLYSELFWNPGGFLHRYITTLFQTQTILKTYGIKFLMHQAFYHHFLPPQNPDNWNDKEYKKDFDQLSVADKKMWDLLDSRHFMYLNDPANGTFHNFIIRKTNGNPRKVLSGYHPNALGHKIWAEEIINHISQNKLFGLN